MEKYVPDIYQKSIYTIDYDKLKARGIKCLLYDLDNTLVPFDVKEANQKIKNLFDELKEKGFKVIIFSNSPKTRLKRVSSQIFPYFLVLFPAILVNLLVNKCSVPTGCFRLLLLEAALPVRHRTAHGCKHSALR